MANETIVGWTAEPPGRGTFGILRSCVITLALCVYTAVHVNIPRANASRLSKIRMKAIFVAIGMFAPELIVYLAWCQRQQAVRLTKELNEIFSDQEAKDPVTGQRRYKWTIRHSFYAVMGGFAIDTGDQSQEAYIPGSPRLALYPCAVVSAAKMAPGILPDISLETINDKSKADGLAKTLALVQASWLILDSISRWAQSLVVTPLELNAFAHAICALLVYCLWWHKPLDVNEPTKIDVEPIHSLAAIAWASSDDVAWYDRSPTSAPGQASEPGTLSGGTIFRLDLELADSEKDVDNTRFRRLLRENKIEPAMPFYVLPGGRAIGKIQNSGVGPVAAADPQFHRRWAMAWQFRQLYPTAFEALPIRQGQFFRRFWLADSFPGSSSSCDVRLVGKPGRQSESWSGFGDMAGESISHRGITDDLTDLDKRTAFVILSLSALAYGGLHGSAWRDTFPTSFELLIWRISSVYMAASGIFLVAATTWFRNRQLKKLAKITPDEKEGPAQRPSSPGGEASPSGCVSPFLAFLENAWENFVMALIVFSVVLFSLGYLLVRIFLVVEAFLALRALPTSAYSTPDWTRLLAHL